MKLRQETDLEYEESGLIRGRANDAIEEMKQEIWRSLHNGDINADENMQKTIEQRSKMLDALEQVTTLTQREGTVVFSA